MANKTVAQIIAECQPGDISEELLAHADQDVTTLQGRWKISHKRSGPVEPIMAAMGVGIIKRKVVKSFDTMVDIKFVANENRPTEPSVEICTYLPMNRTKEGLVFTDGRFEVKKDDDTSAEWTNWGAVDGGRLLQLRTSKIGTMYDIRVAFPKDPCGMLEGPVKLFLWTFVDAKGKTYKSERWFSRIV